MKNVLNANQVINLKHIKLEPHAINNYIWKKTYVAQAAGIKQKWILYHVNIKRASKHISLVG